jgi:hypothetical protein
VSRPAALAVFAYASLVDAESAAETLAREVEVTTPARLSGWRRRWSLARDNLASEKCFARADDGSLPRFCLGLNLEPAADGDEDPNGALIEVTMAELRRLDLREIRYRRLDVTDAVTELPSDIDRAFAYAARPERFAATPPEDAVIIANYLRAVEDAFDALGAGQLDLYRHTTQPPPAPVIEGILVDDRIPEGNPRAW